MKDDKIRPGVIVMKGKGVARMTRITILLFSIFWMAQATAESESIVGKFLREDGVYTMELRSDSSYELHFPEGKTRTTGLYENSACWEVGRKNSNSGTHMFYTADGDSCCMEIRYVGSRLLVKQIAGYSYKVCNGGVFTRIKPEN